MVVNARFVPPLAGIPAPLRVQQTRQANALAALAGAVPSLPVAKLVEVRGVVVQAGVDVIVQHGLATPARVWFVAAARGPDYPLLRLVRSEPGRLTLVSATAGDVDLWVG